MELLAIFIINGFIILLVVSVIDTIVATKKQYARLDKIRLTKRILSIILSIVLILISTFLLISKLNNY